MGSELSATSGTEACRHQRWKQAGGAWGIARSACATMRVPRRKQRGGDRDSKGALARLLGSPDRNTVRGQRPGVLRGTHLLASALDVFSYSIDRDILSDNLSQYVTLYLARFIHGGALWTQKAGCDNASFEQQTIERSFESEISIFEFK